MPHQKLSTFIYFFLFCMPFLSAGGIAIVDGGEGVYLKMLESNIDVTVNNQIATVKTTTTFFNNTEYDSAIKYGLPLHAEANPVKLRWYYNGVWKEASIGGDSQDNSIPGGDSIVGGNEIDPLLLDFLGETPLLFSPQDVIEAGSEIIFEITYVELLPYFLGKVSFDYPNDISVLQQEPLDKQSLRFELISEREIVDIELFDLTTADDITPFHAILYFETLQSSADFNYFLEYELSSDGLGVNALSTFIPDSTLYCDDHGEGFITFIIEPESNVNTEVIEKNFTFVIDQSGSMDGDKIVQARNAASFIVNNLNYGDRFNIIVFNGGIQSLFNGLVDYDNSSLNVALDYIDDISAGGSTNIAGALTTAIAEFEVVDQNKANIILFFTDGQATEGITDTPGILEAVNNAVQVAETSIFLFTFGIGEGANQALLTLLAQQNSGLVNIVDPQNLESEITTFFLSINNPVLLNTQITFTPDIIHETYPFPYPNLYEGQQLILSGRYEEASTINMHLEGQAFNVPVSYDFEVNLADTSDVELSILPKIWAKQKIDALTLDFYLADDDVAELIQAEIDSISICYGVVSTDFTSFEDDNTPVVETTEVHLTDNGLRLQVNPSPFEHYFELVIQAETPSYEPIRIELYNASGQLISVQQTALSGAISSFRFDQLDHLAAGVYFLKVHIADEVGFLKIMKGK